MRVLLLVVITCFFNVGFAQDARRLAEATELTYFGLDCSLLKVIGESATGEELVRKYFTGWNGVVVREKEKYDLARFFNKQVVHYDLAAINRLNSQRAPSDVIGYENQNITEDDLIGHVNSYHMEGTGIGLVIVLENFNKYTETGTMWVTFFDISNRKVLLARKMSAEPMGFGFRNYWVHTIYDVLEESSRQYRKWVK